MGLLEMTGRLADAWTWWALSLFADVGAVVDYVNDPGEAGDAAA
jgi:hypothetical protein